MYIQTIEKRVTSRSRLREQRRPFIPHGLFFILFFLEIPKNLTQVVFANEDYSNVPKLPNNELTHRYSEENGKNGGGNGSSRRNQFQQSRSQTKSSSDVKGFHRNGESDSPYDKRFGSNAGMYTFNYHVFVV